MSVKQSVRFLRISLALSAACCTSCAGLKTPYPDKAYFAIDAGQPDSIISGTTIPSTAATSEPLRPPLVIQLRGVQVASPYDEPHFVYKIGPSKFETDYYNAFAAEPASLLNGGLMKWLSTEQPAGSIVPSASEAHHDLVLEGYITSLYADLENKEAPQSVIEGRFMLIDDRSRAAVVFDKTYQATSPAKDATAPALAAAWGAASRQMLESLNGDLSAAIGGLTTMKSK